MKKVSVFLFALLFFACTPAELENALGTVLSNGGSLSSQEVGSGLKQALNFGISKGSDRLSSTNGYYKSIYKILLPKEARQVTDKLKVIPGFTNVEDVILEKINRAAEDAAKKAKPIFVGAIKQMSFQDAMGILMGNKNAATSYLDRTTRNKLYGEFEPVIVNSLNKFNAIDYWADAVNAYNKIPLVKKVNPKLDDYVTTSALNGLFGMVEKEELNIRSNLSARTTDLLKRVFAKQD